MPKYIKKPVAVNAVEWTGYNRAELFEFTEGKCQFRDNPTRSPKTVTIIIPTLEGDMGARDGDYIIRGVDGEFYPCKREKKKKTYEKIAD